MLTTAQEVAAKALEATNGFVSEEQDRLLKLAGNRPDLLVEAAAMVPQQAARGSALEHCAEHVAFSLLSAAFEASARRR